MKATFRLRAAEFLPADDSGSFADDHELIGVDRADILDGAARPSNAELRGRRRAQSEMQAAIVDGIET